MESFDISKWFHQSCQVILEFMDKGIKGLLTGDLSIFVVKKIQHVISKNEAKIK